MQTDSLTFLALGSFPRREPAVLDFPNDDIAGTRIIIIKKKKIIRGPLALSRIVPELRHFHWLLKMNNQSNIKGNYERQHGTRQRFPSMMYHRHLLALSYN